MIAMDILNQLGGNRFVVMTGAKDIINLGNGLQFTIGRNYSKANRVIIKLNGKDLYDVYFKRVTNGGLNRKTWQWEQGKNELIKEYNDIYCDQLVEIFEQFTHMYAHL